MNSPILTFSRSGFCVGFYTDTFCAPDGRPWLCMTDLRSYYYFGRAQKLQITSHTKPCKDRVHLNLTNIDRWVQIDYRSYEELHCAPRIWFLDEISAGRPFFQLWIIE